MIWSGGGTDNNWSTKPDWDYLPTNDDDLMFAGTTRLSNANNSLSRAGSITFNNTAGAFTLSGNALTIAGGITNNSTSAQTIGLNLTLSAAQQFNAASGNLAVNGTIAQWRQCADRDRHIQHDFGRRHFRQPARWRKSAQAR